MKLEKRGDYEQIINKVFFDIYLMKFDSDITKLKLHEEEVERVKFFSIKEMEEGLKMNPDKFVPCKKTGN